MKRLIFPITLILLATLFLSACSAGGTTVNETPGVPNTGETSVVGTPTGEATTAMTEQATTTTGTSTAGETSTPASTSSGSETSTPAGTSTSTAGTAGTSTPVAGNTSVPVTGATESYVRLSTLLNGAVTTSDGTNVGTLAGVLVQHPVVPVAAEESSTTPAASPTPAPTMTAEEMAFTVRYVLVDVSSGAGNASGSNSSSSSSNAQAGNGRLVVVPWQAFDFSTVQVGSAKLNVEGSAISSAPHFTLPDVGSPSGAWFGQLNSYWAGQNLTGFTASNAKSMGEANMSLITRDFRDLAITGPNGEDFGRISDLLIDPTTGQVMYAVFSGGADLNNQVFVIPVNLLDWTAASGTQLGSFAVNVPLDTLQKSPVFQSPQNLTLDPNTVQQLQDFWKTVNPSGSSK